MKRKFRHDYILILATIFLVVFGLVMVYSSSAIVANEKFNDSYYYLKRQSLWALIGFAMMILFYNVNYRYYARLKYIIYISIILVLLFTIIPGVGHSVNGARRWISFGGVISFQSVEFARLGLLIFFSALIAKKIKEGKIEDFKFTLMPILMMLSLALILIQWQPDMGSVISISLTIFALLIVAGVRLVHLLSLVIVAIPMVMIFIAKAGYRRKRILSFLDPWQDFYDSGYQIIQSYIAMGRGGFFGEGLGESIQKLFYLPEAHTDFIFSIITEELGFIGAVVIIFSFSLLAWRGFSIANNSTDLFGSLLAFCITFAMVLQVLINISVATGIAPTKGLPLPFISLGGSALVSWMISVAILLNIDRRSSSEKTFHSDLYYRDLLSRRSGQ